MNIAQERSRLGLTQRQLADKMHVSERTIQNWEAGKTVPGKPQAEALEQLFAEVPTTDNLSRLISIIESQQRVIETLTREHNT